MIAAALLLCGSEALVSPLSRPAAVVHRSTAPVCEIDPSQLPIYAGAAAVLLGGGAFAFTKSATPAAATATAPADAVSAPVPTAPAAFMPKYTGKITASQHRMAGRMKKTPPREQWDPPPGWMKPTKPVVSWYDRGDRLVPDAKPTAAAAPAAAATPAASPSFFDMIGNMFKGGSAKATTSTVAPSAPAATFTPTYTGKITASQHRGAGRMKKAPAREQWDGVVPAKAKAPAAKAGVESWYDAGMRLA